MGLSFKCGGCRYVIRFKGKKSEISRGKDITCPRCRGTVSIVKKHNGKVVGIMK